MYWFAEPRQTRRDADNKFNRVFFLFSEAEPQPTAARQRGNAERRRQFGKMNLSKAFRGNWKGEMKERRGPNRKEKQIRGLSDEGLSC